MEQRQFRVYDYSPDADIEEISFEEGTEEDFWCEHMELCCSNGCMEVAFELPKNLEAIIRKVICDLAVEKEHTYPLPLYSDRLRWRWYESSHHKSFHLLVAEVPNLVEKGNPRITLKPDTSMPFANIQDSEGNKLCLAGKNTRQVMIITLTEFQSDVQAEPEKKTSITLTTEQLKMALPFLEQFVKGEWPDFVFR